VDMASCSRSLSREARSILNNNLVPFAQQLGAEIATACPFHTDHDHLLQHEQVKQPITQWQWRCGLCGKVFKSEQYIDAHLERRHKATLPAVTGATCLADYCDILRCPSWVSSLRHNSLTCRPAELDSRRAFCQHLMHDCFVTHTDGSDLHHAFETIEEHFCEPLSCSGQHRLRAGIDLARLPHANPEDSHTSYYVVAGLLLCTLAILYGGVLAWYSEVRAGSGGLSVRRGRRQPFMWLRQTKSRWEE